MLSVRALIGLFIVAFFSSFILFLPASVVAGWSGLNQSFSYSQINGTVWHAHVKDAAVRGFYLGDIEYQPSLSLLYGKLSGDVKYRGQERTADFSFQLENETILNMKDAVFSVPVKAENSGIRLDGILTAHSENFVYDLKSGCRSGDLDIKTNILENAFSGINIQAPMLTGVSVCDAGVLKTTLVGENDFGEFTVNVFWRGTPQLNALFTVKPALKGEELDRVTGMMQIAGMKKSGNTWQKQVVINF